MKAIVLKDFDRECKITNLRYFYSAYQKYTVIPREKDVLLKHPNGYLAIIPRNQVDELLEVVDEEVTEGYSRGNDCDNCVYEYWKNEDSLGCRRYDRCKPCYFKALIE